MGLRVLGLREDGFHNLHSAFIPIGWSDVLEVNLVENGSRGRLNFSIAGHEIEGENSDNLIVRAHDLLSEEYDLPELTATLLKNIPSGVSIESASYMESNNLDENINTYSVSENSEEYTPKLFSEDQSYQSDEGLESNELESHDSEQLFDQDNNEEEDFEIPAFLRKQKF